MIKRIELCNWKSFKNATLYIDQMSFVIGTNASGKSNALDALGFLQRLADGANISDGVKETRGGFDWLIMNDEEEATLRVVIKENDIDYRYDLTLRKLGKTIIIYKEGLYRKFAQHPERALFETDWISNTGVLATRFYTAKRGSLKRIDLYANTSILSQAENLSVVKDVKIGAALMLKNLRSIFILNPLPNKMRAYVPLSTELDVDGGNVAGVLAGMDDEEKKSLEKTIGEYLYKLPERDVERVWAEKVGRFGADAMLYCEEKWTNDKMQILDARGMSDGTLRFISIILALLTRPEGSLLVVEEIDNGLHPSRSEELVSMLHELGTKRHIDILCTTHNPVLIDQLGFEMVPYISVIKRSMEDGSSQIHLLEENDNLIEIMVSGTIGDGMISNKI